PHGVLEPRPFEEQFQERLQDEGHHSDEPDPHGVVKQEPTAPVVEKEPATAKAPREVNPDVEAEHGKEIARMRAENAENLAYEENDVARKRLENTRDILASLDKVADPAMAAKVIEEMQKIDVHPDGTPEVEIKQKLLK